MDQARSHRLTAGLTLIEVLVSAAVMLMLLTATLSIYVTGLNAQTKSDVQTDAYRAAMISLGRIRAELRGCQLVAPTTPGQPTEYVTYLYPMIVGGVPQVDQSGLPIMAGAAMLRLTEEGRLVKTDTALVGETQVVTRLQGRLLFERLDSRLLKVTVVSEITDPGGLALRQSRYAISARLHLPDR
ncbi:MAG: hypothetical protein HY319_13105 [Armatimonadetes bacterium]|nr:hypothetical protein [Armatimonadota bacterium]